MIYLAHFIILLKNYIVIFSPKYIHNHKQNYPWFLLKLSFHNLYVHTIWLIHFLVLILSIFLCTITIIHKILTCYEYLNIGIKHNILVPLFLAMEKYLETQNFLALLTVQNIFSSRVLSNFSAGCFCNSHVRTFMMLRIQNA